MSGTQARGRGSVQLRGVRQVYPSRRGSVTALDTLDLDVADGEFVCVRGASGSGKTTLLMMVGGMRHPTAGRVVVAGQDLYGLDPAGRAAFRAQHIGFVFQTFHLVPYLDLVDNVRLAGGGGASDDDASARAAIDRVGLEGRAHHKPDELSAGERQRVAVVRALHASPTVVLADEPTGNLDPDNAKAVLELLADYHRRGGTVLLVTHGDLGASYADRTITLEPGIL